MKYNYVIHHNQRWNALILEATSFMVYYPKDLSPCSYCRKGYLMELGLGYKMQPTWTVNMVEMKLYCRWHSSDSIIVNDELSRLCPFCWTKGCYPSTEKSTFQKLILHCIFFKKTCCWCLKDHSYKTSGVITICICLANGITLKVILVDSLMSFFALQNLHKQFARFCALDFSGNVTWMQAKIY